MPVGDSVHAANAAVDNALGAGLGVAVDYFDGSSARAQAARVYLRGAGRHRVLVIEGRNADPARDPASGNADLSADNHADRHQLPGRALRLVPWTEVQWPERQRHGPRIAHLQSGGALQCDDGAAWDAFARSAGAREPWVVRAQQQWLATLVAACLLIALVAAGYVWGVPWAARGVVALVPMSADRAMGEAALGSLSGEWLQPTELSAAEQGALREAFARAVTLAYPDAATRPAYDLRFHKSRIGPNAFALPGGAMVVTDALVRMVDGRADVVVGVLGHELGHVRQRHGMRMVVQLTLMGAVTSAAFGDFSSLLAAAPALLGQAAYSRDHEREADVESVKVLRAAGLSPAAMLVFFEKVKTWRDARENGDDDHAADAGASAPTDRTSSAGESKSERTSDRTGEPTGERESKSEHDHRDHRTETPRTSQPDRFGIAFSSHPADDERIAFFRDAAAR